MHILIVDSSNFSIKGFCKAMDNLGHSYKICKTTLKYDRENPKLELEFMQAAMAERYDAMFSFNYQPLLAKVCHTLNLRYISWLYDNPLVALYSSTLLYPTNYCFLFDGAEYETLHNGGVETVYHLPLAADINNYGNLDYSKDRNTDVISFVGSMYNEEHNFLDRLKTLPDYMRGYIDGILYAQQGVYGQYILEDALTDDIIDTIQKEVQYTNTPDGVQTLRYVYANYFLARKLAAMDRYTYLKALSENFRVSLYTHNKTPELPRIRNKGEADYFNKMPYVFHNSRINLNIGLRSIKTGISLRCFDILACGGFLMSSCQTELFEHFVPGEDFDYFTSPEDLVAKCRYYLDHDDKRAEIAKNGFEKAKEFHSFERRIEDIFNIVFN